MAKWWQVLVVCALLAVPTVLDPDGTLADTTYLAGLILIIAALWWGAAQLPRADRAPWTLLALAGSCWLAGDTAQRVLAQLGYPPTVPSLPDVFWLASYPLLIAAVTRMIRARGLPAPLLREIRLDMIVVTAAASVAAWHLLLAPTLAAGGSTVQMVVLMLYPLGDVAVFGLAITLAMTPGDRGAPGVLLMSCLALTLPIDFIQAVVPGTVANRLDSVLLVVNSLLAAAALHPARRDLTRTGALADGHPLHRWRIVLLGVSLCTVSIISAVPEQTKSRVLPSVLASVVISVTVVIRFYRAVQQREAAEAALSYQARHDQLTGAANRLLLMDRLVQAARDDQSHGGSSVLISLDLDDFKLVNDTWGHQAGDVVLCTVTHRLAGLVRPADTVARVGGDEFVVLCRHMDPEHAEGLAHRMRVAILEPIDVGGEQAAVGASIGILTVHAESCLGPDELLRQADSAMYRAKRAGGGVCAAGRATVSWPATSARGSQLPVDHRDGVKRVR